MNKLSVEEMVSDAASIGLDEELQSYALQIQRMLTADGDGCPIEDAIEMAYNELILSKNKW